ncbi:hypothetical protein ACHAXA_000239 [Cyclostephanos tholiformis]|uniref:Uncharacterized protein n=1 Tax=Cyclostephanos tholiformis TaxID=382380 RepID=A0ABD3RF92_9STRA
MRNDVRVAPCRTVVEEEDESGEDGAWPRLQLPPPSHPKPMIIDDLGSRHRGRRALHRSDDRASKPIIIIDIVPHMLRSRRLFALLFLWIALQLSVAQIRLGGGGGGGGGAAHDDATSATNDDDDDVRDWFLCTTIL